MATCPTCRKHYPDETVTCEADGEHLLPDQAFSNTDADLGSGDVVGEYRIESKIGQGGFGTVYRAVHPVIGKAAAIKVLNRQYSSNPQMVSRFIAEARAVNQIQSRNIIDIFSFGTLEDGRHYYVMELLEGVTLDRYLKQRGRLGPEEAVPIFRGIGRALDAAHEAGIAHRDLKPENIFLRIEEDGSIFAKLLDFGIAKLLGDEGISHKTRTGQPIGTPYYMSPEQCRGRSIDHRTDIYSLGILVHEALTGKMPFTGEDVMDLLVKQTTMEPPRVSSVCPDLSSALDKPVLHLLQKDPAARPVSAGIGIEALARAAKDAGYDVEVVTPRVLNFRRGDSSPRAIVTPSGMTPDNLDGFYDAKTVVEMDNASKTLLDAESDVPPTARRRKFALVAIVATLAGIGAAMGFASSASTGVGELKTALVLPQLKMPGVPQPVPASPATVVPAPLPEDVALTIQSTPKDVDVFLGETKIGSSAEPVRVKRGKTPIQLTLKAPGYTPAEVSITPSDNTIVSATLVPVRSKPVTTSKPEIEF